MSCVPGSPKTGGRKKGTPNKCRKSIDYFAEQVFKRVDMVQEGIKMLTENKDPRVKAMIWCRLMDYKFGRPREQLVVTGSLDVRSIVAQARERALSIRKPMETITLTETPETGHFMDCARSENGNDVVYLQQSVDNLPQHRDGEDNLQLGAGDAS